MKNGFTKNPVRSLASALIHRFEKKSSAGIFLKIEMFACSKVVPHCRVQCSAEFQNESIQFTGVEQVHSES
jgi:hypothetical protein